MDERHWYNSLILHLALSLFLSLSFNSLSFHALPPFHSHCPICECSKSPGFGTLHCGIAQLSEGKPLLKHTRKATENPTQTKSSKAAPSLLSIENAVKEEMEI